MWFQRRDERYVDQVKLMNNLDNLESQQMKEAGLHLAYSFLNAASVLMQQGQFKDAVYSCTKALEFDSSSAKGYFRRAQACSPQQSLLALEAVSLKCMCVTHITRRCVACRPTTPWTQRTIWN